MKKIGNVIIVSLGIKSTSDDDVIDPKDYQGVRMTMNTDDGSVIIGDARVHAELFTVTNTPVPKNWIAAWLKPAEKIISGDKYHLKILQTSKTYPSPEQYGLNKPIKSLLQSGLIDANWRVDFNGVQFGTTAGQFAQGQGNTSDFDRNRQAAKQQKDQEAKDGWPARRFVYQQMRNPQQTTWTLPRENVHETFLQWVIRTKGSIK